MKMILELHSLPDHDPKVVSVSPDERNIEATIRNQSWDEITFVVLKIDEKNWFEISGSPKPEEGLSASCCEGGQQQVSDGSPGSLDACVSLMLSFFRGDNRWRNEISWH